MTPLSIPTHDAVLSQIFKGAAALAVTGPILVRLHTADPGAAGTANVVATATWTNYADAQVNASGAVEPFFSAPADDAGHRATQNVGAVSFGTAVMDVPASTVNVTHVSLHDSNATPLFLGANALAVPKTINDGDPVSFPAGTLKIRLGPAA